MTKKEAIIRGDYATTASREAYDELKVWAQDALYPEAKKKLVAQLNHLARKHGVGRNEIIGLLMRPPFGETRTDMINFLYDVLFSN